MEKEKKETPKIRRSLPGWWLPFVVLAAMVALIAGVLIEASYLSRKNKESVAEVNSQSETDFPAPAFALQDQQGRPTSLAQFRGKVVALTFIDPECTQLCPLTTQSMVEALKLLGPDAASHVQLLGVDANPLKTKVADVAAYTRTHELQGRWRFLTGSRADLERVWQDYHVYVAVKDDDIEHTAIIILIDGKGNERTTYSTPMDYQVVGDQAHMLAEGIAQLLPGQPAVAALSPATQQAEKPLQPNETVNAVALGPKGQRVALGSTHPHLVLFFAGWLEKGPDLEKNLAALDSYAALARQHGWPSPVAIDELPTEPSPAEARSTLIPVAAKLHTPVVEDTGGRLAGAYHVGDLPWFELNSDSGDILWRHDGWLSATALNASVRAALAKH